MKQTFTNANIEKIYRLQKWMFKNLFKISSSEIRIADVDLAEDDNFGFLSTWEPVWPDSSIIRSIFNQ